MEIRVTNLEKRINLNRRLGDARKGSLSTLARAAETSQCSGIVRDIELGLPLELILEVLQKVVIKILTTQVSISSSSLDSEDTTADVKQRNIESSSS